MDIIDADVDHLAGARLLHLGIGELRAIEGAREVGIHDLVVLGERVFLRLLADVDAGVVDEDVEPAVMLHRAGDQRLERGFALHVDLDRDAADLLRRRGALLRVAARHYDLRAGGCQSARHAETDTAVAAGHYRYAAFQIKGLQGGS